MDSILSARAKSDGSYAWRDGREPGRRAGLGRRRLGAGEPSRVRPAQADEAERRRLE